MSLCLFVSDLQGSTDRFDKLFSFVRSSVPDVVFLGGDILPSGGVLPGRAERHARPFIPGYLAEGFGSLRRRMRKRYPLVAVILGNDDPRREEPSLEAGEQEGLWRYLHGRKVDFHRFTLYGYSCIPPSPFMLKDWERYDVSRYVDVGASAPYLTLHGHVHESARLSGHWRQRISRTWCLSAAHDGPELAVVRFDLEAPEAAERLLV